MLVSTSVAPPNSLVLIADPSVGNVPSSMSGLLISATDDCIAVGCRAEDDGEREIALGDVASLDVKEKPAFQQRLRTPSRTISVSTVLGATLLEMAVPTCETPVAIWVNDSREPDKIQIGIG